MKRILRFAAAFAILAVPAAPLAAQARASGPLADSLRTFAHRIAELLRQRDVRSLFDLYGDPAHFVHIEAGTVVPWPQLAAMVRSYFDTATSNPISVVGEPGVTLVDRDNAVIHVTHRMEGTRGQAGHDGVWTGVLHRFPDGWKIVHSHSSDRRTGPPGGS